MADPLGSVEKVVKLALAIKEAVVTVRRNEQECRDIEEQVARASAIISRLQETQIMTDDPAMEGALVGLGTALGRALELVTDCQARHVVLRFFSAGEMSRQLRRVQDDISQKMMLALFATHVQTTIVLMNIQHAGRRHPLRPQEQDAQVAHALHGSHPTHRGSSEVMGEDKNVASGSETPFPSLPAGWIKFSLSELVIATNDFSEENIIGKGGFATIYKGVLRNGLVVAIKKCRRYRLHHPSLLSIDDEATLVSKLEHKNVAKLVGIHVPEVTESVVPVKDKDEDYAFWVEEYMPNGSFEHIIDGSKRIDWSTRLRIILGIAQGIQYLHEQHIVHLDLTPRNILLDSDMNPVIIDFGIARQRVHEPIYVDNVVGSLGYIDPLFFIDGFVSKACDTYAFGVILLETIMTMFTDANNRQQAAIEQALKASKDRRLMKKLFDPSQFNKFDLEEIKRCIKIGVLCVSLNRLRRPTMLDVLQMLNGRKKIPRP